MDPTRYFLHPMAVPLLATATILPAALLNACRGAKGWKDFGNTLPLD